MSKIMYRNTAYGEVISDSNIKYKNFEFSSDMPDDIPDDYLLGKFISGDIVALESNVTTLSELRLYSKHIQYANFPELITVAGRYTFNNATIYNINVPKLQQCSFDGLRGIRYLYVPNLTYGSFHYMQDMLFLYAPNLTELFDDGLGSNKNLTHIYLPKCTTLIPDPIQTYNTIADYCTSLKTVNLPMFTTSKIDRGFYGCTNLELVDFGSLPAIVSTSSSYSVFKSCAKFNTLIIRTPTLCTLNATHVFNDSCFASGKAGGTLYVPQSLISSYQNATNWKTILGYPNNKILPLEGSPYETPSTSYDHY